ncbi:MAG: hypothetical protein F6K11_00345 [Leptolyngbya sp. SIO3F4]|nr:hypothetical protein [Leptolyngbya sp. SIO3F4]
MDADRSVASEESSNEALFFDPSDVDGESTQTFEPGIVSLTDTEMFDATQVADNWLFDRGIAGVSDDTGNIAAVPSELGDELPPIDLSELSRDAVISGDVALLETREYATVENLFGDTLSDQEDTSDDDMSDVSDTVSSLSEILPDEQVPRPVDDFPDNVPDDIYIAASADEDLINLAESAAEQRLLIDFANTQLIEQLDQDLQKLAGDSFSADYEAEEDDALEPLDQTTLETIVSDLKLEDLNLDDELRVDQATFVDDGIESATQEISGPNNEASLNVSQHGGPDLFEGFPSDTVDIDYPSDSAKLDVIASTEIDDGSPELDLLGLGLDALGAEELDDSLPDSLADELQGLSERSNALSQEPADEVIGQFISDLEEPVIVEDATFIVPSMEETEPRLDSASMPDLPSDLSFEEVDPDSPEADDFLRLEQEAFWRTMADDEGTEIPEEFVPNSNTDDLNLIKETEPALNETVANDDMSLDAVSADLADDIDDLLLLDNAPSPTRELESEEGLDLRDLDDLFGESLSISDLEPLGLSEPADSEDDQTLDPLVELNVGSDAEVSTEAEVDSLLSQVPEEHRQDDVESFLTVEESGNVDSLIEPIVEVDFDTDRTSVSSTSPGSFPPVPIAPTVDVDGEWFLGLDVGATGLSAVLMNRQTGQVYPLYWQKPEDETKHFRLPAVAVVTSAQDTIAVGYDALGDLSNLVTVARSSMPEVVGLNRLKPLLKVAVGYGQTLPMSEPWLRWSNTTELPILQVLQAMVALLRYLLDRGRAVGLEGDSLAQIWSRLQGVIVGYPTNWPDTYSFNLREAVLEAGLIGQPEQVLFVEDAIATILSGLPDPNDVSLSETVSLSRQPSLYNCQWQEGTVVISGGAVMTELGLVNLPKDLTNLSYADFALRGFAYAGDALDQDIVCQLLLPEERRQPLSDEDTAINWDWQGHLSNEDSDWAQLNLDSLTLPTIGHVDWAQRYALQQHLLASNLGQSLLAAARHLKLALQQQSHVQIALAGQRWVVKRRHLENLIFLPYVQRINRYLNVLLSHQNVDAQSIKQVICTGGSASLPAIARWLRQKFPNATIIQDTYASELPQSCSRVAYGLANLARYSQVLNVTRQQYSDYFLLMELLRVFPQQPLPVGAIMHLLEQRGINTQACHLHILALLEGHLPPGLVPTDADRGLICDRTSDLSTYRALLQTPLFSKTVTESGGQMYIPNEAQAEQLRAYVNRLLINKVQTLEEPLIAHLETFA